MRKPAISILIIIYSCALLAPVVWENCKPLAHLINSMRRSEDQFVLVVSKQVYHQLKHEENEMWWNGYLVDVHSVNVKDDVVELVVETDHFETTCTKHKIPKEPTALWQWFNKVYTCDNGDVRVSAIAFNTSITSNKNYPLTIAFLNIDCPPPDESAMI